MVRYAPVLSVAPTTCESVIAACRDFSYRLEHRPYTASMVARRTGMRIRLVQPLHRLCTLIYSSLFTSLNCCPIQADSVVVLQGGSVAENGTYAELMAKPDGLLANLMGGGGTLT